MASTAAAAWSNAGTTPDRRTPFPGWATARLPAPRTEPEAATPPPFTIAVMSPAQRRQFAALAGVWLAATVSFLLWWFQGQHVVSVLGMAVNSAVVVWLLVIQTGWYLFFVGRMRRPNPACPLPEGRVAMVVTKAPSEPWPVVQRTLEAMLGQDFPRPYDVWLADEDPDGETRRWCAAHGVQLSCRKGVPGYHNAKWPRRTRCKEGNLSYFYDRVGYDAYDFVAQLDADHVPERGYLTEMIRPFADHGIGYVAAPSICDSNAKVSWAARARLHAEAGIHGALQAGYAGIGAPMCIGSHYAVRTRALRDIGGLGPELAEDHSTTLLLNAGGWRGGFALEAIAHGDGPAGLADFLTQEFQWSRSLVNVLLSVTPRHWRGLASRVKLQFAFCQLWYIGLAASMLLGYALPIVTLVTGTPWANVDLLEFFVHSTILLAASTAMAAWIRRQGWFRPADAPLLSWEAGLYHLLKWPWVFMGVGYAVVDSVLKQEFAFKVTPKGAAGVRPLPLAALAPTLLIAGTEIGAALLVGHSSQTVGAYALTLLYGATYLVAIVAAVALHRHENRPAPAAPASLTPLLTLVPERSLVLMPRLVARPWALTAAATILVAGVLGWEVTGIGAAVASRHESAAADERARPYGTAGGDETLPPASPS